MEASSTAGRRGGGREREEEERLLRREASLTREFRSERLERDMVFGSFGWEEVSSFCLLLMMRG
jgi:hypothetical protein